MGCSVHQLFYHHIMNVNRIVPGILFALGPNFQQRHDSSSYCGGLVWKMITFFQGSLVAVWE